MREEGTWGCSISQKRAFFQPLGPGADVVGWGEGSCLGEVFDDGLVDEVVLDMAALGAALGLFLVVVVTVGGPKDVERHIGHFGFLVV